MRGQYKFVLCPGDPDQLFDLVADPFELHNAADDPGHADVAARLRTDLEAQYDLTALEEEVLTSQARRRLVAQALQYGTARPWDFEPDPEQRYVRGDFWTALKFGQIREVAPKQQ
ncbi:hypothetical protein [Garicola koreensis]|uniref:Choline sulfatase enzyme C-terminal domain-containing protein n=1 Tax=Garicola koreensis TaxID=1262554 RepID=A0A7W5TSP2_9MICC|nr:hypothetical protein [Garicola koreensis]